MRVLAHICVQLMYKPWKIRLKLLDKDFFVCTNHENFLEGFFYTNSFTENFSMYVQTMKIFECDLEGKRSNSNHKIPLKLLCVQTMKN